MSPQICSSTCMVCQKTKWMNDWDGGKSIPGSEICFLSAKWPSCFGCCGMSRSQPFHSSARAWWHYSCILILGNDRLLNICIFSIYKKKNIYIKFFFPSCCFYFDRKTFLLVAEVLIISIYRSCLLCLEWTWAGDCKAVPSPALLLAEMNLQWNQITAWPLARSNHQHLHWLTSSVVGKKSGNSPKRKVITKCFMILRKNVTQAARLVLTHSFKCYRFRYLNHARENTNSEFA